jgi:hypothetical protein
MRATELLGCRVYDLHQQHVGDVHDLRFTRDGPAMPWRLDAIAVGTIAIGHRFGYGSGDMAGPWPLSALMRSRHRHSSLVIGWDQVARFDRPRIELRSDRAALTSGQEQP